MEILQARILNWDAMPCWRGSSQSRDWTQVSHIAGGYFTMNSETSKHVSVPSSGILPSFMCLVVQSCLTLCDPMDCTPPGTSVHGASPSKNTGMGCHTLLQGIFPTHGLNPGLPHCRWIFYCLSYQGSPRILEWVRLSLLQRLFPTQESNRSLLHCRWILYQLS